MQTLMPLVTKLKLIVKLNSKIKELFYLSLQSLPS